MRLTQALIAREERTEAQAAAFRIIMLHLTQSLGYGEDAPLRYSELEDAMINLYHRFTHLQEG